LRKYSEGDGEDDDDDEDNDDEDDDDYVSEVKTPEVMELDDDSAASSDYSLLGRMYKSKSLPGQGMFPSETILLSFSLSFRIMMSCRG